MLVTVWSALEGASQVVLVVKNLPTDAGDARDAGLVPGLGRSPEKSMASHSSTLAFVGRIKGAKCPFDLQFLTWDFCEAL